MERIEKGKRTKTVGELFLERLNTPMHEVPVEELGRDILQTNDNYMENLYIAIASGKRWDFGIRNGIFYINVMTVREQLFATIEGGDIFRFKFKVHVECPTPTYAQTVYKYTIKDDNWEVIWTLPDREACTQELNFPLEDRTEAERKVFQHILNFYDGTLDKQCHALNGEKIDYSYIPEIQA